MKDFKFIPENGYIEVTVVDSEKIENKEFEKKTGFIIPEVEKKTRRVSESEYSVVKYEDKLAIVPTHMIIKVVLGKNELFLITKNMIMGFIEALS